MRVEIKISKKPIDYVKAIKLMEKRLIDVIKGNMPEFIWVLEHKSVFTTGISHNQKDLLDKKQEVIKTNRGGKITYHGPGQIVFYVVINLNKRKKDIRWFINILENTVIETLNHYKIKSFSSRKNVGIWVRDKDKVKKIAAIGIKVKKWIAYHGFALNISNNLNVYKKIVPCGIRNRGVSNLNKIKKQNYKNIENDLIKNFLSNIKN